MTNITENANLSGLKRENFQATIHGKKTDLYILRNRKGYEVAISNYGGAIVAIMVPDKDGNVANVIQGHDSIQQLTSGNEPYLSTLIGRWGNRICKGQFTLNGKEYQLALNDGPNHLHGGKKGFNAKVWEARQMGPRSLALHRISSYGEEGYTGELDVTVEYTFTDENELVIEYLATTNKKTIVNLTHHAFFCLQGAADPTPTIEDQLCEINGKSNLIKLADSTQYLSNCVTGISESGSRYNGTICSSGSAPITTPAAWVEAFLSSPSSFKDISISFW